MGPVKVLIEVGVAIAEYLLNRARKPAPAPKPAAVREARDAWERSLARRKSN